MGNGSCGQGTGTIEAYQLPTSGTFKHSLRFIPLAEYDEATNVNHAVQYGYTVKYDAASKAIVCTGAFTSGTTATLYNMGGLSLGTAAAEGNLITLPIERMPHGSYLVVIRSNEGEYAYKILL